LPQDLSTEALGPHWWQDASALLEAANYWRLRNVPDALHRRLKARAAMAGMSLSDDLLAEIKEIAERPTLAELRERLHKRKPVSAQIDTARLVREERAAR
jgi:antitoxin FitA